MKFIQPPHAWLVSGNNKRQVRWHILSDFPPVGIDGFSQRLNKLLYSSGSLNKPHWCYTVGIRVWQTPSTRKPRTPAGVTEALQHRNQPHPACSRMVHHSPIDSPTIQVINVRHKIISYQPPTEPVSQQLNKPLHSFSTQWLHSKLGYHTPTEVKIKWNST